MPKSHKNSVASSKMKKRKKKISLPEIRVAPSVDLKQNWCQECGSLQILRPGKTQPTCVCHLICDNCGGRKARFLLGEDKRHPDMSGEWCVKCGPFH